MYHALLFTSDTFVSVLFVASGSNIARVTPQALCPGLVSSITRSVDNILDQSHLSRILLGMDQLLKVDPMITYRRCSEKSET
jgi:hypothetical protein